MHVEHRLDGESIKNYKFAFFFLYFGFYVWACAARWDGPRSPRKLTHFFTRKKKGETDTFAFFGSSFDKKKIWVLDLLC